VHEWLAANVDRLPPARRNAAGGAAVAVQDPCHLRHVQRAHQHVRTVLRPYVTALVELDDEGLCCGAGGAYAALHAQDAAAIRARKLESIARSGAPVVASANPGCSLHLAAAGLDVRHPVQLIDEAVRGG
jgi:glycolate oxidase iron-sulfur subunit